MLPLLLALACAPWGRYEGPLGADRWRAAYHREGSWGGEPALLLLLANSPMPCSLSSTEDPAEREEELRELGTARSREGAVILGFALLGGGPWEGDYPLSAGPAAGERAAWATLREVEEAEVSEAHGLYLAYQATLVRELRGVDPPGSVKLEPRGDAYEGSFALDSAGYAGTFRSEPCEDAESVFTWLGLDETPVEPP